MTQEAQLKACPFCGDKDDYNPSVSRLSKYAEPGDPEKGTTANLAAGLVDSGFYVECDKCGACGPPHETEGGAVELWNIRIESGVVAELVEWWRALVPAGFSDGLKNAPASMNAAKLNVAQFRKLDEIVAKLEASK